MVVVTFLIKVKTAPSAHGVALGPSARGMAKHAANEDLTSIGRFDVEVAVPVHSATKGKGALRVMVC